MENKQPAAPSPSPSVRQTVVLWRQSRLQVTDSFSIPPEAIRVHNSVIGTPGNFSASTGKAKSKKTFNVSAIVAAALAGDTVLCYRASLPEGKRKILYVDTEQSPYHCIRTMKRILRLAALPFDRQPHNLEFLSLRRYTPDVRLAIIEQAVYGIPDLGLVIIDGIRDLVYDINSPGEATHVISRLMQWTDERHWPSGCSFDTLTAAEHGEALRVAFEGGEIRGHENLIEALQKGYASVGFERGRNIMLALKKHLMNRQMITREGKGFRYCGDAPGQREEAAQ
jgi:hypothetical protein